MEQIRELAKAARAHNVLALSEVIKIKAAAKTILDLTDSLGLHESGSSHAVDSILARTADMLPPEPEKQSDSGRVVLSGFLVGAVCLLIGAGPRLEAKPVNAPQSYAKAVTEGRLRLSSHDWQAAFDSFDAAYRNGYAGTECLEGMIQCKLRLGDYKSAWDLCEDLERESNGKNTFSLRLRGLVQEAEGNKAEAVKWYKAAESAGDVKAGILHRRLSQ